MSLKHFLRIYLKTPWTCNYFKKETPSRMFSCKFCEFLHSTFERLLLRLLRILQIFGRLLLDFLLLNSLFVNVMTITNLTNIKLYFAELTRIYFSMKLRSRELHTMELHSRREQLYWKRDLWVFYNFHRILENSFFQVTSRRA